MNTEPTVSFEDLAEELSPQLSAYLKRLTKNSANADDLLQETLMKIAEGLSGFEHRAKIKTWAYKIATNTAIDFMRKSGKMKFTEFEETDECADFDEEDRFILDEMNECVRQVIDNLPPDYRAVVVLFYLEGKSLAEIAEICDLSLSATKVRIHRARGRLQEALNKECTFYKSADGNLRCDRKS